MSERLPTRKAALRLLEESGCSKHVVQHCKTVAQLAVKMAKTLKKKGFNVDVELVEIGALLHDIGRSKTHSVDHAIVGAEIAKTLGLPNQIIQIIERHVGSGIPPDEAEKIGWPKKSYMPETLEERIVSYADKLVEGSRRISVELTIKKFSKDLGENHPSIPRLRAMHEEFQSLLGET